MFSRLFAKRKETDVALDALLLSILEDPEDHAELLYIEHAEILYNPRRRVAAAAMEAAAASSAALTRASAAAAAASEVTRNAARSRRSASC